MAHGTAMGSSSFIDIMKSALPCNFLSTWSFFEHIVICSFNRHCSRYHDPSRTSTFHRHGKHPYNHTINVVACSRLRGHWKDPTGAA